MLSKTERLYGVGVNTKVWKKMYYPDVLELKIKLASVRIQELNLVDMMNRELYNITECENAIKHCTMLLNE